jgi:CTP synthase (UTP-ammonia lyase)
MNRCYLLFGYISFLPVSCTENRKIHVIRLLTEWQREEIFFLDWENQLDRLNHFPSWREYQCFLPDGENRVVLNYNPARNPKVWELYRGKIGRETLAKAEVEQTTVQAETPVQVKTGDTYVCTLYIERYRHRFAYDNEYQNFLQVHGSGMEQAPMVPETAMEVKVEVTPETLGSFHKTVTAYGNAENALLQLTVTGEVNDS